MSHMLINITVCLSNVQDLNVNTHICLLILSSDDAIPNIIDNTL